MTGKNKNELVRNRSASHHYEILDTFEAGIVLLGTEVKSLRDHGGNLQDSYVKVKGNELWLIGASIAHYKMGNIQNHEEKRDRKLLMHKKEIISLKTSINEKGLAIIPLSMYLSKGKVKVSLAKAKGKKAYDKRQKLKSRETEREIQRQIREI